MAEDYEDTSPYTYVLNNPLLMVDYDGMSADTTGKVTQLKEVEVKGKDKKQDNKAVPAIISAYPLEKGLEMAFPIEKLFPPFRIIASAVSIVTTIIDLTKSTPLKFEKPIGKVSRVSEGEIKKLKDKGFDPHPNKPKQGGPGGKIDLWKDSKGYLFYRTEKGSNYEPLYENINSILK